MEIAIHWQICPILSLYKRIEIHVLEKVEQICVLPVPQQYTKQYDLTKCRVKLTKDYKLCSQVYSKCQINCA